MEESLLRKLKRFARENIFILSFIGFIVGAFFTFIGTVGVFFPTYEVPYLNWILDYLGYWDYWVFMLAIILAFACVWFMYSNIKDRKKFNDLIETGSKATFVRNQDELEEIAFRLGSKYQDILFDKKRELKIK